MTRKRNNRMRRTVANCQAVANVVENSSPPPADKVMELMNKLRFEYERLKCGTGTAEDAVSMGMMVNVGWVRAHAIGKPLVAAFKDAGNALLECEAMKERHGAYGFTGPGLLAMNAAMDLYADLLALSSPNQMEAAEEEVLRMTRLHVTATAAEA